jgi:hypothetical protein
MLPTSSQQGGQEGQKWNLLICHRYILSEGEYVIIEIVGGGSSPTNVNSKTTTTTTTGQHCKRVNPSDALRPQQTSQTVLDRQMKEMLKQLHAKYLQEHPNEAVRGKAVISMDDDQTKAADAVPNQPSSMPTIRPTGCSDSPTSRPTSIPTLDMTGKYEFSPLLHFLFDVPYSLSLSLSVFVLNYFVFLKKHCRHSMSPKN